jgi:hypothetical protein
VVRGAVERLAPLADRARELTAKQAITGGLLVLAAGAVAIALIPGGGGDPAAASAPGGPTVALERRDLTSTVSVDGTLGFTGEAQMINRLQGTFTWLPAVGDVIRRGDRAFSVDGRPVLLMYGKLPAYRELATGVSDGADVEELERNLAALGFDDGGAMTVDDSFTSATAAAVSDWQDSVGLPQTGSVELGRVVFAPGPRRVESVDAALGSNAAGSGGGGDGAAASNTYDRSAVPTSLASVRTPPKRPSHKSPSKPASANSGSSGDAADSADTSGSAGSSTASTDVITTTSLRRAVTVDLDANQLSLAKRGRPARITLPDGSRAKGRITAVGTTAESSDDSGSGGADSGSGSGSDSSSSTVQVTIAIRGNAGGLAQAPVTVDLIDELRRNVFAVPVGALVGTAGGHYAIVVHEGSERRQIPVQPGLFADSYVEVSGSGLTEGMRVEVPQL